MTGIKTTDKGIREELSTSGNTRRATYLGPVSTTGAALVFNDQSDAKRAVEISLSSARRAMERRYDVLYATKYKEQLEEQLKSSADVYGGGMKPSGKNRMLPGPVPCNGLVAGYSEKSEVKELRGKYGVRNRYVTITSVSGKAYAIR